jgi:hypothetical protein
MALHGAMYDGRLGYLAIDDRQLLGAITADTTGVFGAGALVCTAGSGVTTNIAAGRGSVVNTFQAVQGGCYLVRNDAAASVTHPGSFPLGNTRYDIVGIRVYDSETGGDSSDSCTALIVSGALGGGPPANPNNFLPLYQVLIHAADTTAASFTYTDIRVQITSLPVSGVGNVPSGAVLPYGGSSSPAGFFLCNGQAISRTTYSTLFGIVGTAYGVGDGSTTFNVPDLRQRFPLGLAASGTGSVLGGVGGNIDHTHTISDPGHTHTLSSNGGVQWSIANQITGGNIPTPGGWGAQWGVGCATTFTAIRSAAIVMGTVTGNLLVNYIVISQPATGLALYGTTDSGATGVTTLAANPPFQTVNYIIKT